MWKDLPKGLVSAVAAINQKSREAFVAEQQAQRKPKLPGVPAPKADPAANAGAADMAKKGIKEGAEGTLAKTPKEKELAAHHGDKTKITQGDVLKARGVGPFNWRDTARQTSDGKTKTGHIMKKTSTGTQYTKEEVAEVEEGKLMDMGKKVVKAGFRALTGGSDKDQLKNLQGKMGMKQTGEKPKSVKEEASTLVEYFDKVHIGDSASHTIHSVDPENGHYTVAHKKTGKKHDVYVDDKFPHNTYSSVHKDVQHHLKGSGANSESSEIAKHITKHISIGQEKYKKSVKEEAEHLIYETRAKAAGMRVYDDEGEKVVHVNGATSHEHIRHAVVNRLIGNHGMKRNDAEKAHDTVTGDIPAHGDDPHEDEKTTHTRTLKGHASSLAKHIYHASGGWRAHDSTSHKTLYAQNKDAREHARAHGMHHVSLEKNSVSEEVEQIDELSTDKLQSYMYAARRDINKHLSAGDPPAGSKRRAAVDKRVAGYRKAWAKRDMKEGAELNTDTPGNSYEHQCAIHVKHSKLGEGRTLYSQHAEPDAEGNIAWYDVMFAEGISRVKTDELEVLVSESHMNHKKKAK